MEGFRPGVAERLGLGPDACLARNPKLVYGRMTGWGQEGPMARPPATTSTTSPWPERWIPSAGPASVPAPLNLVGDFGGGGMLLAFGMLAAVISAQQTGSGQVVDAAMVDGAASLMTMTYTLRAAGMWPGPRGTNLLDTGAHFYEVYETADGGYMAVGAIESQFYAELIRLMGLEGEELPDQMDRDAWPAHEGAVRHGVRHQDPGRVGSDLRGQRRLRRTGAVDGRSEREPPQPIPRDLHRGGRRGAARTVASLHPDPGLDPDASTAARSVWRRGPGRVGPVGGGDQRPPQQPGPSASPQPAAGAAAAGQPAAAAGRAQRLTTGQVTVRVIPSISWMRPTTIRPNSSTVPASARTMTS